ncbi:MAG: HAMP domain-containing histidine kinase [Chloroflexi bacterium]|nr:HAMP domain-containing histidine kinase [Chloroflexota bacterium]MCI0882579.1 HAMP domain-containing histidine kinase [Chloroflexota bacterium]
MRLQTRLVATFILLLLGVVMIVGIVVVGSSRSVLLGPIDEELVLVQSGITDKLLKSDDLLKRFTVTDDPNLPPVKSAQAIVIVDISERVVSAQSSGFTDDPDPLPGIEFFADLVARGGIATIPSEDGTLNYRAFGWVNDEGEIGVLAVPIGEVDAAVDGIVRTFLLTAAVVALLGGIATWWAVRRELRPVDQMVDTAIAIAGGDLTQRVHDVDSSTELGRLGTALNEMLVQIEDAITQEKAAKERLTNFIADASHELRTPIAAVLGYSELYRNGALLEKKDIDNAMRRIGTETSRMERLVADLLLLARLDQPQAMVPVPVNLAAVVRDAVTDSQAIDPDHPITVIGSDSVRVIGDEQRLTQVVANLLANARVHTPKGTQVTVTLREEDSRVILDVVDDGPGLPEKDADKLFERFYRIDSSRSRSSGGAGLGLAIVAAIVAAHDGTIEAANQEGHGARVTLTLPASA